MILFEASQKNKDKNKKTTNQAKQPQKHNSTFLQPWQ